MQPALRAKPRPTPHPATYSRGWTIAQQLRARRGWLLDMAHADRFWSVRLDTAAFKVSAHVSLFLHGPGRTGMVVALNPSFPAAMPRAIKEGAMQYLRTTLGERYRDAPYASEAHLITKLRTDRPNQLLAEIAHVEHVLEARAARRFGPSPRSQDRRHWHVVEALRASSWLIHALSFTRMVGDRHRGLHASIGVIIDSEGARRGLSANFGGWITEANDDWMQFFDSAVVSLAAEDFRINEQNLWSFHVGRWGAGLSGTRALKQVDVFDRLLETGAELLRRSD